jgi:hypothetical protein
MTPHRFVKLGTTLLTRAAALGLLLTATAGFNPFSSIKAAVGIKSGPKKTTTFKFEPGAQEALPYLAIAARQKGHDVKAAGTINFNLDEKTLVEISAKGGTITVTVQVDSNSSKDKQKERFDAAVAFADELWKVAQPSAQWGVQNKLAYDGNGWLRKTAVVGGYEGNSFDVFPHVTNLARTDGYSVELGSDDVTLDYAANTRVEFDVEMNNQVNMTVMFDIAKATVMPDAAIDAALTYGKKIWAEALPKAEAEARARAKAKQDEKRAASEGARVDHINRALDHLDRAIEEAEDGERTCRREVAKDLEDARSSLRDKKKEGSISRINDDLKDLKRDAKEECPSKVVDYLEKALDELSEVE